jgi:hypothetical protein
MDLSKRYTGLHKVISGGQTGADQGGLMAAHQLGVLTGGTAPAGFMTSRGPLPLLECFGLKAEGTLQTRTKKNIMDSDATVVLSGDLASSGTVLTIRLCKELQKPCLVLDIASACTAFGDTRTFPVETIDQLSRPLYEFLLQHQVRILNVAGNRERFDDARTTHAAHGVVATALSFLDLDNLLIRDSDL